MKKILLTLFLCISLSGFSQSDTAWKQKYVEDWYNNPDNANKGRLERGSDGEILIVDENGISIVVTLFLSTIILFSIISSKKKTRLVTV